MKTISGQSALTQVNMLRTMRLNEERLRQLVEFAPVSLLAVDQDGLIILANVEAERLSGYPREALIGKPFERLIPERFRNISLKENLIPYAKNFFASDCGNFYVLRADGSEVPVDVGLNLIVNGDGTTFLCTMADVSSRKEHERHIESALHEKEILLDEIHHRVKNNMQIIDSLIDMQASRAPDAESRNCLRVSRNRIKAMALIHKIIYQSKDFSAVNFGIFLATFIPTLFSCFNIEKEKVKVLLEAAEVRLPLSLAIPCGLIVNELISNTLTHAFPSGRKGEINLKLAFDGDQGVLLDFSDDGIGIAEDVNFENAKSLGLRIISLLSHQLHGVLSIERGHPTRFTLRFPLELETAAA